MANPLKSGDLRYSREELQALFELGEHFFRQGQLKKAQIMFSGLIALVPDSKLFLSSLVRTMLALGQSASAEEILQKAEEKTSECASLNLLRAEICIEKGDHKLAFVYIKKTLSSAKPGESFLLRRAWALFSLIERRLIGPSNE